MDRDYDGRLTFGEFMGEETPLEKVFKNMDKDGDGTVSKEVRAGLMKLCSVYILFSQEFLKICKNLSKEQVILFEEL